MTTPDDHPTHESTDPDVAATTHADPLGDAAFGDPAAGGPGDGAPAAPAARPGAGRLLLAVLAALVVVAVGIVAWAGAYIQFDREYVGVSVVIGLGVGYVLRVVSRRSTMPVRILAVLITALACLAGTIVAEIAFIADQLRLGIGDVFGEQVKEWQDMLGRRTALTWGIFAAAVVLAYLSAMPQKPSKKAAAAAAPANTGHSDHEPPPPQLPAD